MGVHCLNLKGKKWREEQVSGLEILEVEEASEVYRRELVWEGCSIKG